MYNMYMSSIGPLGGAGGDIPPKKEQNPQAEDKKPLNTTHNDGVEVVKSPEWQAAERINSLKIDVHEMIEKAMNNPQTLAILGALNTAVAAEIERRRKAETGEDKKD